MRRIPFFLVLMMGLAGHAVAEDKVDGKFGPGALYRIERPTNWNGSVVLYAHGDVYNTSAVALPPEGEAIYALLKPYGFAFAYSSFSETGWAVKDGAQRTHQLLGIFISRFGQPRRVYIAGASMGGLIAIKLAEDYPGLFSGVLPTCAVAGSAQQEFDYQANTRVLFDFFYPGVLPGDAGNIPPGTDAMQSVFFPALAAMQLNPVNAFAIAAIDQTPIPYATPAELFQSIATAVAAHAETFPDLISRTHGHPFFDNSRTQYSGAVSTVVLAAINATVQRFHASPSALNYLDHYDNPSGDLHIPMLMLSDARDPVVPGFNQTSYSSKVAAAGNSGLLVQRQINRYGHCDFTVDELGAAFLDLVSWVEFGLKPIP